MRQRCLNTLLLIIITVFLLPLFVHAQEESQLAPADMSFKAEVIEVTREQRNVDGRGREVVLQVLRLRGREGEWKDKEFTYDATALNAEVMGQNVYQAGDKVLALRNVNAEGEEVFYVTDYVRAGRLYFLIFLFLAAVLVVGRWQGMKAFIGLAATFVILMKFIIPKILAGSNPLLISIIGSLFILMITLYLVHGFNSKTTIAISGTLISLLVTGLLSILFTNLTRLTGFADEETAYLMNIGQSVLNMKGILLAGMIIGALGVLDDITVSQASIAEQIYKANPELSQYEIYKRAMKVGIDHVSSIVNTLVLAYAGASLPLMLLFGVSGPDSLPVGQVINNEVIATEIVRTVVGSVGLVVAVPITTFIAAYFYKKRIVKPAPVEMRADSHIHTHSR